MWKTGDRVLGKRAPESYWYPGTVRHIDGERLYVIFDDGEDALVLPEQLTPIKLQVGDRVATRLPTGRTYVPGQILASKGDELHIQYDSGEQEWTPISRVRLEGRGAAPAPAESSRWNVGDTVFACWHDLYWYPGIVLAADSERLHVLFDDGKQALVLAEHLRPRQLAAGDRVFCRWKGGPDYHPGEVTEVNGEVIHVNYDDGDEETTSLRLVRLERDDWFPPAEMGHLSVGERVLGCWFDLHWYPGIILALDGKRLHVLFDDGDQALVTPDRVKPLDLRTGDRVCCRWKGGPIYYPGEITRLDGEVIHVNYDDGDEETTSIRLVRIEREGVRG
jgi:hypothetical protein